ILSYRLAKRTARRRLFLAGRGRPHHRLVDGCAMALRLRLRSAELLERRVDVVKKDIGDEAVDAGIDAGRRTPVHIAIGRNEVGKHFEIGEAARGCRLRRKAADALEVIALEVEVARLEEPLLGEARMLAHQRVAESGPRTLVVPTQRGQ